MEPAKCRQLDVYETPQTLVLVGRLPSGLHRMALVRRMHSPDDDDLPPVSEEPTLFGPKALADRLAVLGATKLLKADALLGMVRFLEGWYLLLVTRREPVGVLSGARPRPAPRAPRPASPGAPSLRPQATSSSASTRRRCSA